MESSPFTRVKSVIFRNSSVKEYPTSSSKKVHFSSHKLKKDVENHTIMGGNWAKIKTLDGKLLN